jgi:hypothetical protein
MSIKQSPGKIYLAGQRGQTQNSHEQNYSTFNYGDYYEEHKQALGSLYTCNDITLTAGANAEYHARLTGFNILIPITGVLLYADYTRQLEAGAGEALVIPVTAGTGFTITNADTGNAMSFILLQIADQDIKDASAQCYAFDLDSKPDELITINSDAEPCFILSVGCFKGRSETVYHLSDDGLAVFALVIAGAFEVQNRLLHERDGLALWDIRETDAEALSNNAVLLLIELK